MDLVQRHQRMTGRDGGDGAAAVLVDRLAIVIGAEADIEARMDPGGDAAPAAEETVGDAGERRGADGGDGHAAWIADRRGNPSQNSGCGRGTIWKVTDCGRFVTPKITPKCDLSKLSRMRACGRRRTVQGA
jgi:hypothetical protein